jgi:hypothetical protein
MSVYQIKINFKINKEERIVGQLKYSLEKLD